jgi:GT2 family glycosyltransferase
VRATSGEIVVFLDSDMEAREGFLAAHLAAHRAQPRSAVIGRIVWPRGGGFLRYIGSRGAAKLAPGEKAPPWYFVTGNASVERRDLPGDAPFDETIPGWGGEDLDLGLALARTGVGFMYVPEAVSDHHFTGTLTGHLVRTFAYGRDSLPVLVGKHPELRRILRLNLLDSFTWRLAVSGAVYRPAAALALSLDRFPLPGALYDYLTFSAYARGWLEGKRKEG